MNDDMPTCAYCGFQTEKSAISAHILDCTKRPEVGLLVKMQIMRKAGDVLLDTIYSLVKAMAEIEGMRSKAWDIYRTAKETWEEVKNLTPEDIAEVVREELKDGNEET